MILLIISSVVFLSLLFAGFLIYIFVYKKNPIILGSDLESDNSSKDIQSLDFQMYYLKKFLLSPAEYSFYYCLMMYIPSDLTIVFKVRLSDVFGVKSGSKKTYQNKINQKHFDFLVINKSDAALRAVIELDDKSHKNQRENDVFKDEICKSSGVILIRIPASSGYTQQEIVNIFKQISQ
jgi:hypothetical protein